MRYLLLLLALLLYVTPSQTALQEATSLEVWLYGFLGGLVTCYWGLYLYWVDTR
jgi:hypothetical protein